MKFDSAYVRAEGAKLGDVRKTLEAEIVPGTEDERRYEMTGRILAGVIELAARESDALGGEDPAVRVLATLEATAVFLWDKARGDITARIAENRA